MLSCRSIASAIIYYSYYADLLRSQPFWGTSADMDNDKSML